MDTNTQLLVNAACIDFVPEVLEMTAMIQGFGEALAAGLNEFAEAVAGQQSAVEPSEFFSDEFDGMAADVIEQLNQQADKIREDIDQYDPNYAEAQTLAEQLQTALPGTTPLLSRLGAKDVLAYIAVRKSDGEAATILKQFMALFTPAFEAHHAKQKAAEES